MEYFMLMLRAEKIDFALYSPDDYQKLLADFDRWNNGMIEKGSLIASASLRTGEGKTIRGERVVKDGPYSEAKEVVTGFFVVRAENYEKAVEIGSGCPFLTRGGSVEVRLIPRLEFEDAAKPIMEEHASARAKAKKEGKEERS